MHVHELRLNNFRVFKDHEPIQFSKNVTVIAGINGRGKTAILDALSLLFQRLIPQIAPTRKEYRYCRPTDVHANTDEAQFEMAVNCAGIPIQSFSITYNPISKKTSFTELTSAVSREIRNAYGNDKNRSNDAAPIAVYYTTDRAAYRLPRKLPLKVSQGQEAAYRGALVNRTVDYKDFMARFRVKVKLDNERQEENPDYIGSLAVQEIQKAVTVFLQNFKNLRVPESTPTVEIDKIDIPLCLPQLSDGERSFLAVICDLGRRLFLANPKLDNPLHGAGVVLIDELELHLHPTWQREVVEKLRTTFPNIQFIATTHSPFIIQSLRPGELINLDPDEFAEYADKSIEDIAENIMGVEIPQKSERYLKMMRAAEEYFQLLREERPHSEEAIIAAKQKLAELSAPFSDDPAFQALLDFERKTQMGGDSH